VAAKTILIVDDDLRLARLLEVAFTEAGYRTIVAKDGAAAFVEVEIAHPDLMPIDVFMPVIDGATFGRIVRANPATRDTPIIVMSGTASLDQVLPIAIDGFLAKPFDMDVLLRLVVSLIGVPTGDADGHE
jgi:CheY-like chemotaxis protein